MLSHSKLRIDKNKIFVRKGWIYLWDTPEEFTVDEIESVQVDRNEQSGSSDEGMMTFTLELKKNDGSTFDVAEISENRGEVRYLKQQLEEEPDL